MVVPHLQLTFELLQLSTPCIPVVLFHTVILSHCPTVLLSHSHCHTAHYHTVTLTLSYCHTVLLSHCPTVILSYRNTILLAVTLSCCHDNCIYTHTYIHIYIFRCDYITITSFGYLLLVLTTGPPTPPLRRLYAYSETRETAALVSSSITKGWPSICNGTSNALIFSPCNWHS